ncbi:uncharacterized protein F4807DRAFT_457890 [Annulohypoxylon truncatum]|uniref:uncharacterized protein n=1 Tax=Annulohypoxylon truncatum TaxID=327061 RepID=UPI0020088128|nr:uncharacterized protein F4807DRAFT_457890 [Annulohypoxylon truncatum]KAI1212394.1 hypothetical protein F4807DRAFT_457890 [Annulohypoxylon truncatum]
MSITRADLGLSCPNKGKFYVCDQAKIRFIGCCTVDPCVDGSGNCPQSSLASATFSSDHYDSISPQSCAAPHNSSEWYTCKADQPPFLGCCDINPCSNNGCPTANLLPATLSDNNGNAQVFLNTGTPSAGSSGYSLSLGAILGIALGCAALVAIVLAILAYRCGWLAKRKRQGKEGDGAASQYGGSTPYSPHMSPFQDGHRSGEPSPGFPNSGFAPYSPTHSQYRHPQLSPALSDSWHGDNRHVSNTSELSGWSSVSPDKKHQSYAPLLAPATELEGRDTERPVIAELPSSPATNVQR